MESAFYFSEKALFFFQDIQIFLLRRQWRRSGVFIVNFEHISHLVLVLLLLTLS